MTYQEFKSEIESAVSMRLSPTATVSIIQKLQLNDITIDSLLIREETSNVSPSINLDTYFTSFENGQSIDQIAGNIINVYNHSKIDHNIDLSFFTDYEKIKDRIVYRLVSKPLNADILNDSPYIDIMDLSVIFYLLLDSDNDLMSSIRIRNCHLKQWDKTREELYKVAKENTRRLLGPEVISINELLGEMTDCLSDDFSPLVVTNTERNFGACVLLYPGLLENLSLKLEGDFYIIPSSVHETIVLPLNLITDIEEINNMIDFINHTELTPGEILSNHLYKYDSVSKKLVSISRS